MKNLKHLALILAFGGSVFGQGQTAPPAINYQGRLTQSTGVVVPDGLTGIRVRIFATASGGSALWDSGDLSVATKSGTFSILLGSGTMPPMSPAVFALGTVYLEVQPTGQAPLLPRQPIASVPWSLYAETVPNGSITTSKLGDQQVTLAKLAANSVSGAQVIDGSIDTVDLTNLAVTGSKLANDPSSLFKVSGGAMNAVGGLIGIGTANPKQALHNTGDYYGRGSLWLYAYGGDGNSGTAYIQARDTSNSSSIDLLIRTQIAGNYVEAVKIAANGNVGIGTTGPQLTLSLNDSDTGMTGGPGLLNLYADGNNTLSVTPTSVQVGGQVTSGNITVYDGGNVPGAGGQLNFGAIRGLGAAAMIKSSLSIAAGGTEAGNLDFYTRPATGNPLTQQMRLEQNGTFVVFHNAFKPGGGPWSDANSDARLKTDIRPVKGALESLLTLRGVHYRFKDPTALGERAGDRIGFIAQQVETAFPQWVVTKANGYKTIAFDSGFDALTVEAFRDQQVQIEGLTQQNRWLIQRNQDLESRLRRLERIVLGNRNR